MSNLRELILRELKHHPHGVLLLRSAVARREGKALQFNLFWVTLNADAGSALLEFDVLDDADFPSETMPLTDFVQLLDSL